MISSLEHNDAGVITPYPLWCTKGDKRRIIIKRTEEGERGRKRETRIIQARVSADSDRKREKGA